MPPRSPPHHQVHGRIRRYTSPDEYAFFPEDLPPLVLPPITYEQVCGCARLPAAALLAWTHLARAL